MFMNLLTTSLLLGAPFVAAETHKVIVGGAGLSFDPTHLNASTGDTIRFEFRIKNHTATQSSFKTPCQQLAGGFDSGFQPVAADATSFPYADFAVLNTMPAWFYCKQGSHCSAGMVFAVNPGVPPAPNTFDAFKAAAMGIAPPTTANASATSTVATSSQIATPTPSPTPALTDHVIVVGGPGLLAFQPSNITAKVGETVIFQFKQKNHTATQSSFAAPCRKLELTSTIVGFDSGFQPVADGVTVFPEFKIKINDTSPVWVYCKAGNHCGSGMVFSVNADESGSKSFSAFQAQAKLLNGTQTGQPSPTGQAPTLRTHALIVALVAVWASLMLQL